MSDYVDIQPFVSNLNDLYQNYQATIIPSRYEAFPMVALESLSHNIPVISFKTKSGIKDIITDNKDGLLVPLCDTEKLADAIIKISRNFQLKIPQKKSKNIPQNISKKWIAFIVNM